jgi:hypothetical protein
MTISGRLNLQTGELTGEGKPGSVPAPAAGGT